jgi:predicted PurR-regulated permease PerM
VFLERGKSPRVTTPLEISATMNFDINAMRATRAIGIALAVIIVMSVAAEVLKPLALATLLSFILVPFVKWLQHRGLPRVLRGVTDE